MYHKHFLWALASLIFSGCAMNLPTHEGHPPHTLGQGGIRLGALMTSNPTVGPTLISGSSTETGSLVTSGMGYSAGVGVLENLDLNCQLLVSPFSGSTTGCGVKWQFLGSSLFKTKGGEQLASLKADYVASAGYKDSADNSESIFSSDVFVEKMDLSGITLAASYGYQVSDWFAVYLGLKYMQLRFESEYRDGGPSGTFYSETRDINTYGPLAGFSLNPTGKTAGFELTVELNTTQVPATYEDTNVWSPGLSIATSLLLDL